MSQTDPIIRDAQLGLFNLATELTQAHRFEPGVAALVLFETLADLLRARATMEFDEYLAAFVEELPKGSLIDQERLDGFRDALIDTVILTTQA